MQKETPQKAVALTLTREVPERRAPRLPRSDGSLKLDLDRTEADSSPPWPAPPSRRDAAKGPTVDVPFVPKPVPAVVAAPLEPTLSGPAAQPDTGAARASTVEPSAAATTTPPEVGPETLDAAGRSATVVSESRELLAGGQLEKGLRVLQGLLRENPDDPLAQAAIQEVRQAWRIRGARLQVEAQARQPVHTRPATQTPTSRAPVSVSAPAAIRRSAFARTKAQSTAQKLGLAPAERRKTPLPLVLLGAGLVSATIVGLLWQQTSSAPGAQPAAAGSNRVLRGGPASPADAPPGPLTDLEPKLVKAIESTIEGYVVALSQRDPDRLAAARPDLDVQEREALLRVFQEALNASTRLRIIKVQVAGEKAHVALVRTDYLKGSRVESAPVGEAMVFLKRGDRWSLRRRLSP